MTVRKLNCMFEMHICTDGRKYIPLDDHEKVEKQRDVLVDILADLFGWQDRSYLHAVMHVENAVNNLRADLAMARKGLSDKQEEW